MADELIDKKFNPGPSAEEIIAKKVEAEKLAYYEAEKRQADEGRVKLMSREYYSPVQMVRQYICQDPFAGGDIKVTVYSDGTMKSEYV